MSERVGSETEDAEQHGAESIFASVPPEQGAGDGDGAPTGLRRFAPLVPSIVGLALGRAGLIVANYGSYTSTDEGLFTDGATLASLAVFAVLFLILAVTKRRLTKPFTNRLMRACVFLEACILAALAALSLLGIYNWPVQFGLSVLCMIVASGAIFYWLRRARGAAAITAAVYVFAALILSEIEIYLCTLMPLAAGNLVACALVLVQYPCMLWARKRALAHNIRSLTLSSDYFGFAKNMLSSTRFLIATAVGIGCLSIVIGLLRGYPNGQPIVFTSTTRFIEFLVLVGISGALIALVIRRHQRIMTVGIFILMELLACLAIVCYAAFPDALDIGAIFTTTLNALMVAFTWYIAIAFASHGWRDPYYYSLAGFLVWLGSRAIARVALLEVYDPSVNGLLMCAVMGSAIVISTQVVFIQFLKVARFESEVAAGQVDGGAGGDVDAGWGGVLSKIMGLDEHDSLADMRHASLQHNAEEIGRQFMLSEREVEVLALYALGFTQKRVAEELFISPGTAHAHIKRIYAKTGLHSRQEILDYMQHYTS